MIVNNSFIYFRKIRQYRDRSIILSEMFLFRFIYWQTFVNFSSFEKSPWTIDKLMRSIRGISITYSLVNCFIIDGGRQSCPGALLFNWEITHNLQLQQV